MKRAEKLLPMFANEVQKLREALLWGVSEGAFAHEALEVTDFKREESEQHFLAAISFLELAQRQLNLAALTERKK